MLPSLRTGEPELMAEVDEAGPGPAVHGPGPPRHGAARWGCASALAVPIRTTRATLGVLALARTSRRAIRRAGPARWRRRWPAARPWRWRTRGCTSRRGRPCAARDEVVAVVSHDLRNPLNAVLIASTVLSEFGDPERLERRDRKQVDVIRRSAEQMTSLTQDLLEVSALESGTVTVTARGPARRHAARRRGGDVHARGGGEGNRPGTSAAGTACRRCRRTTGGCCRCWATWWATPSSSRRRGARWRWARRGRRSTCASGCATPARRSSASTCRGSSTGSGRRGGADTAGAGLGLAIVRSIVEAHGGQVWAESEPGAGSTFHFTLRIVPTGLSCLPHAEDDKRMPHAEPRRRRGENGDSLFHVPPRPLREAIFCSSPRLRVSA